MEASERLVKYYHKEQPNWTMILTNLLPFVKDVIAVVLENRKNKGKLKLIELVMDVHSQETCEQMKERINKILSQ